MHIYSILQTGLTVGEVAGLISGTISLLHIIIPMLFAFILVGFVRDRQFDAVTWSSISHLLQSSSWPILLQSDGAVGNLKGKLTRWRIYLISLCVTLATICLVVANFLTPKPLKEVIQTSSRSHVADFQYAADASFYGQATLPRPSRPIRRLCGWLLYMDCPDSIYDDPSIRNQYINHTVVNSTIPLVTQETFSSGTRNGTIAGPMDVQYRMYRMTESDYVDNNASNAQGTFGVLPSFVLEDGYGIIEGLIVDANNGGVGIRNHTVPSGLDLGGQWTEDILWLTPESKCTNTNLTLGFSLNNNASSNWNTDGGYLRDDGGFANVNPVIPTPRWDDGDPQWKNVGPVPDLQQNADIMAWWNNQFTAQVLNITSSTLGSIYRDQFDMYGHLSETGAIKISPIDGQFLDDLYYNTTAKPFQDYGNRCTGYYGNDPSDSGKAFVICGYLYSVPAPLHLSQGQSWRPDPGSSWTQQLYTCSSAVSASVKEVTFATDGHTTLDKLQIVDVRPKTYLPDSMPIWGIEVVDSKKYKIWDVYKFWGLLDESHIQPFGVKVYRTPEIFLPAAVRGTTLGKMWDSFAAGGVFTAAWESVYSFAAINSDASVNMIPEYSGHNNYGLTLKWRELSSTSAGAAKLLNLIWTDLVAFSIVGTKTGFENESSIPLLSNGQDKSLGQRDVYPMHRSIEYSDVRYAIPAFVAAVFFVTTMLISFFMFCCQRQSWRALNHYMNQTSMGRVATQLMLQESKDAIAYSARTTEWAKKAKVIMLNVPALDQDSKAYRTRRQSRGDAANQSMLGDYEMVDPDGTPRRRYRGDYEGAAESPPVDQS